MRSARAVSSEAFRVVVRRKVPKGEPRCVIMRGRKIHRFRYQRGFEDRADALMVCHWLNTEASPTVSSSSVDADRLSTGDGHKA